MNDKDQGSKIKPKRNYKQLHNPDYRLIYRPE